MPKLRIGFSTDFNLKDEQVGVGTDNPTARLDIRGDILAVNISDTGGISTISRYDGFLNPNLTLSERTSELSIPNKGNLNTLSGEIIIEGDTTVEDDTPLAGGRLDSLTVTGKFDLPHGGSEDREETPEKGSTRFNQDLGQLEFYTGYEWRTVGSYDGSGRGRGVFGGGNNPGLSPVDTSEISYITISSLGNAIDFGTLTVGRSNPGCVSSEIRGVWAGGESPSNVNTIDYNTLASGGAGADFGDLASVHRYKAGCGSSTRGLFGAGSTPGATNVIEYVEISTTSNAFDFGDLIGDNSLNSGALSSPTRGVFCDGQVSSEQQMQFVTIASKGNAITFGSGLYNGGSGNGDALRSCSNSIRGLNAGAGQTNIISYITIATTGNASDFGDLTIGRYGIGAAASKVRGIFYSGWSPTIVNTIDYVNIASTGNAQDFGDATQPRREKGACSDSHGGLGGF